MKAAHRLGILHAVGVVVGAIIGIGIFLTPARVARVAGSPGLALALWGAGGLLALCGAWSLAEVGSRYPVRGGQLRALEDLLGPRFAWLYGWSLLVAIQTGVLVLVLLFAAAHLGRALGCEWGELQTAGAAAVLLGVLAAANLAGLRQGARLQSATSAAKLLILALVAVLGLLAVTGLLPAEPPPRAPVAGEERPWILAGLAAVLFSFGGFHQLTWIASEVRDPARTVPRAIVLGLGLVLFAYLAANLAWFALLPYETVAASPFLAADAVGAVLPGAGERLTAGALALSAWGLANASLLTAPRVYQALADRGLFFRVFSGEHAASGVPRPAILIQTGLALGLLLLCGVRLGSGEEAWSLRAVMDQLVNGVVFVDWSFHILTCVGLLLLHRRGAAPAPAPCPGLPWVPAVFILGAGLALLATFLDPTIRASSLWGVAVLGLGILLDPSRRRRLSC